MWPRRSEILAPLTRLTSKDVPFQCTDVKQQAFDKIKSVVSREVLLLYPDFNSLDTEKKNLLYAENDYNGFDILRWNLAVITAPRARHALPPSRAFCFLTRPTPIHTLHLLSL
jgi:hypothetical protein